MLRADKYASWINWASKNMSITDFQSLFGLPAQQKTKTLRTIQTRLTEIVRNKPWKANGSEKASKVTDKQVEAWGKIVEYYIDSREHVIPAPEIQIFEKNIKGLKKEFKDVLIDPATGKLREASGTIKIFDDINAEKKFLAQEITTRQFVDILKKNQAGPEAYQMSKEKLELFNSMYDHMDNATKKLKEKLIQELATETSPNRINMLNQRLRLIDRLSRNVNGQEKLDRSSFAELQRTQSEKLKLWEKLRKDLLSEGLLNQQIINANNIKKIRKKTNWFVSPSEKEFTGRQKLALDILRSGRIPEMLLEETSQAAPRYSPVDVLDNTIASATGDDNTTRAWTTTRDFYKEKLKKTRNPQERKEIQRALNEAQKTIDRLDQEKIDKLFKLWKVYETSFNIPDVDKVIKPERRKNHIREIMDSLAIRMFNASPKDKKEFLVMSKKISSNPFIGFSQKELKNVNEVANKIVHKDKITIANLNKLIIPPEVEILAQTTGKDIEAIASSLPISAYNKRKQKTSFDEELINKIDKEIKYVSTKQEADRWIKALTKIYAISPYGMSIAKRIDKLEEIGYLDQLTKRGKSAQEALEELKFPVFDQLSKDDKKLLMKKNKPREIGLSFNQMLGDDALSMLFKGSAWNGTNINAEILKIGINKIGLTPQDVKEYIKNPEKFKMDHKDDVNKINDFIENQIADIDKSLSKANSLWPIMTETQKLNLRAAKLLGRINKNTDSEIYDTALRAAGLLQEEELETETSTRYDSNFGKPDANAYKFIQLKPSEIMDKIRTNLKSERNKFNITEQAIKQTQDAVKELLEKQKKKSWITKPEE